MANSFDTEIDSIFSEREARTAKVRQQVARLTAASAAFANQWEQLRTSIVEPAFNEAAGVLARRGIKADIGKLDQGVCLYFHVNAVHSAPGRERQGQPYLVIRADVHTQRVNFEYNRTGIGRSEGIGDMPLDEVDTGVIKAKMLTLIRDLFSDR